MKCHLGPHIPGHFMQVSGVQINRFHCKCFLIHLLITYKNNIHLFFHSIFVLNYIPLYCDVRASEAITTHLIVATLIAAICNFLHCTICTAEQNERCQSWHRQEPLHLKFIMAFTNSVFTLAAGHGMVCYAYFFQYHSELKHGKPDQLSPNCAGLIQQGTLNPSVSPAGLNPEH